MKSLITCPTLLIRGLMEVRSKNPISGVGVPGAREHMDYLDGSGVNESFWHPRSPSNRTAFRTLVILNLEAFIPVHIGIDMLKDFQQTC